MLLRRLRQSLALPSPLLPLRPLSTLVPSSAPSLAVTETASGETSTHALQDVRPTEGMPMSTESRSRKQPHASIHDVPLRLPILQPVETEVARADVNGFRKNLAEHQSQTQAALKTTLQELIARNQSVRDWVRHNKRQNGSMLPHEHVARLPSGVGVIHVFAGPNNTLITLSDWRHRLIRTVSGGMCGLKGYQRGTPEAGTRTGARVAALAVEKGLKDVFVHLRGYGPGREPAFRTLIANGLNILKITDRTPIPHGGCRPRKARRV